MEKKQQQCKLCTKSFPNGKSLGGHMRSHLFPLPLPSNHQLTTALTHSISSQHKAETSEGKYLNYGLRENPKKSYKLLDPPFLEPGLGLLVEDETESRNPTRTRKGEEYSDDHEMKKVKLKKLSSTESVTELEVVSSVYDDSSDSFEDEDVALCLMMLSTDKWKFKPLSQTRNRYKCETCKKVFGSLQALSGHRTSHKKVKNRHEEEKSMEEKPRKKSTCRKNNNNIVVKKKHECPVCYRVFGSGQALGGHKRSHTMGSSSTSSCTASPKQVEENGKNIDIGKKDDEKFDLSSIDLNLPAAPMEI